MEEKKKKEKIKVKFCTAICIIIIIILLIAGGVLGYMMYQSNVQQQELSKQLEESRKNTEKVLEENQKLQNTISNNQTNTTNETSTEETTKEVTKENLTQAELDNFTSYFNEAENNGFLMEEYSNVDNLDVFIAIRQSGIGDVEETGEYEEAVQELSEISGTTVERLKDGPPVWRYKKNDIDKFLKEKIGKTFSDLTKHIKNNWWSDKYQAFYANFGDSILQKVTCTSGTKSSDGKYVINGKYSLLMYKGSYEEGTLEEVKDFTVTLQKQGDKYLFVSNIQK